MRHQPLLLFSTDTRCNFIFNMETRDSLKWKVWEISKLERAFPPRREGSKFPPARCWQCIHADSYLPSLVWGRSSTYCPIRASAAQPSPYCLVRAAVKHGITKDTKWGEWAHQQRGKVWKKGEVQCGEFEKPSSLDCTWFLVQSIPKKDLQGFHFHVSHIPPAS